MTTQSQADDRIISPAAHDGQTSYIDWGAIFAGAVIATAITTVLMTFGSGVGLTLTSPEQGEGVSLTTIAMITTIWVVFVQISAFAIGGYVAGRMRSPALGATTHEIGMRDGVHGVAVWALGTVVGAFLLASAATTTATQAVTTVGAAVEAVADTGADWAAAITDQDQSEIAKIIERRTGISSDDASKRVAELLSGNASESDTSNDAALKAAKTAKFFAAIMAFLVAATALISAVAAWWAADLGGNHRDTNRQTSASYRWRDA